MENGKRETGFGNSVACTVEHNLALLRGGANRIIRIAFYNKDAMKICWVRVIFHTLVGYENSINKNNERINFFSFFLT